MNILITGANGMLGEKCTKILSKSHNVLATDLGDSLLYSEDIPYQTLDITNNVEVKSLINSREPDVIVNCAAYTDVDGAEENKELAWTVNVEGVRNLVKYSSDRMTHVIHISTDYVFDGTSGPYREDDKTNPINYYGETKLESEKILQSSGVPWTIIRTNVLFGVAQNQKASFVYWVVKKIKNNEIINVVNDQYGNPTWADGLSEAIEEVINRGITGLYHYAGLDYVNRLEFALEIASVFSLDPTLIKPTTTRALNQKAKRPFKGGLVSTKIVKDIGVKLYKIRDALNAMKGQEDWNQL